MHFLIIFAQIAFRGFHSNHFPVIFILIFVLIFITSSAKLVKMSEK